MIRVVTLDEFDEKDLEKFCKVLYTAFGVGAEHSMEAKLPAGTADVPEAAKLLEEVDSPRAYADDKILYMTKKKLKERELPTGTAPTHGYCRYGKDRAIISLHGIKDFESGMKQAGKSALHQLGHLYELHHCLDPRCSMYPPWTPSFQAGDSIFCAYCRDKSEHKIRLGKS